jgi:predicted GNAT family acetyltransferase
MPDQVRGPDGTGFYLADGELTVAGLAEEAIAGGLAADFSVTAGLFGGADMDVVLASWTSARTDGVGCVRSEDGRMILPLQTQPVMLNSLPSSVRVQVRAAAPLHDTESAWQLVLHFRDQAGSGLTWHAGLPPEAFGAGWQAPLADLLTIDGADGAVAHPDPTPPQSPAGRQGTGTATTSTPASPAVTVVHHPEDEYYELLVDGQQAGLLVYHVIGSHLSITHTVIEQTYRGRGLSWVLVGRALDDIRTSGVTVSNYCAVVRRFVEKNPEYDDLLSTPRPA